MLITLGLFTSIVRPTIARLSVGSMSFRVEPAASQRG